ncbi:alpha/beta hydrolase family protein [Pseudomarimonas salicorniae]|uniref:Prolyl oligopeptidase family serine peptidase n=1 Tax=Pseudomarimonas salicorniae TaxID=2933270 RepID=A0ABT0GK13_9GAMM|nr:alpha/beta fold hydrolase [Lysobacter sp. CAU 1642]MCK7594878.1 prolyl oligopeptidase family serine peptidase [Lysobacter sp. CAU 1642]
MNSTFRLSLVALAVGMAAQADARNPIPIESLSHVPEIQSVSMSADGRNIVALVKGGGEEGDTALATWNVDRLEDGPRLTASGDRMKFIGASALKADRILVATRQEFTGALQGCGEGKTTGSTKTFVSKTYLTDVEHSKFDEAFAKNARRIGISEQMQRCLELTGTANLVSTLPLDPENVIVQQLNQMTLTSEYVLYNLKTDEAKSLFRGTGRTSPGLFNPRNGEVLTRTELEEASSKEFEQKIYIRKPGSEEFELHENLTRKLSDRYTFEFVGIDEASGKFYVLTDLYSDRVEARMYDATARKFDNEPLVAHPEFSIGGIIQGTRESDFNQVIGFSVAAMVPQVVYVDPELKSIHEALGKLYPGQRVSISGYNSDRSRVLFVTQSHRHPPAYHVLLDRKKVLTLGRSRPSINPEDIGEQRWVTYKARDGLEIPGILDLPAGWTKDQGPLPTVIHPHGGPWSRDGGGWDASGWVPFLTSRGYAVLRPQYRGSSGLGRKLWLAGDSEWGQKMQDDKDDGAAWLVEQGIADPDRLHIFGYSYGGFAAAAAVVRPDSPYQCAISGAPVTDLARLGNTWSDSRIQRILQGRTVTGMDPMKNTDKANIPVLLFVGDRDVRTPSWHAEDFYKAVKDKVTARYELIPDQPHSLPWYPRHFRTQFKLMEEFLNGPCKSGGSKSVAAAN